MGCSVAEIGYQCPLNLVSLRENCAAQRLEMRPALGAVRRSFTEICCALPTQAIIKPGSVERWELRRVDG